MLGIMVVLLVAAELLAEEWVKLPPPADIGAERAAADTYAGAGWVVDYFEEFALANRTEWHSYVYWRRKPFRGNFINIDANGIRRTWKAPGTDSAARKVFIFGSSAMWGTGARDDYTIASYLAKDLASRGVADVEVTNFGEGGYVSMQDLILFEDELRRGNRPDVAVFFEGVNDLFTAYQSGVAGIPQNEENRMREFNIDVDGRIYREAAIEFVEQLALFRLFAPPPRDETAVPWSPELQSVSHAAVDIYLATVAEARAQAESRGIRSLFYWQPIVFTKKSPTPYEQRAASNPSVPRTYYQRSYAIAGEALVGSPVRNLSDVFGDDAEPVYIDFCHLGEKGNEIIAGAMAPEVAAALTVNEENTRH
jgi:lysophospholipase L1-like esterase